MNTNFKVIGLTRFGIKTESRATEADVFTFRPLEMLSYALRSAGVTAAILDPLNHFDSDNAVKGKKRYDVGPLTSQSEFG